MSILNQLKKDQVFTSSEMEVVNYILAHPRTAVKATIRELAELTYSSPSTIGRICKKVGAEGFTELKIKLATELDRVAAGAHTVDVTIPVGPADKIEDFPRIFFNLHYQALSDAYHTIDIKVVKRVADVLYWAESSYILGFQQSQILAMDFLCKTAKLGLPFFNPSMNGFNNNLYKRKNCKKTAALIISQYADSSRVNQWVDELKETKSEICLITANSKSLNINRVHHVILVENGEAESAKIGNFASRTAMSYALDIIYMILFMKDYEENVNNMQKRADKKGSNG
ncbi:MAG: MurR/RpiR family transcriptional regulator [Hungatella sp.]|jgi:DNA-binding MurR/RpiR family transcriptional regulator|nr:MurR/RpiR family transcriptional regulator [Hungatella sp.]